MRFGYSRHSVLGLIIILIIIICLIIAGVLGWMLLGKNGGEDDGKIGLNVTAGTVKVDIEDVSGESLVGSTFDFQLPEGETEVIFAPGYEYYTEGFRIRNEGNLEIKYNIFISDDEEVDAGAFAEAFDVYITTDPENLESAERLTTYSGVLKRDAASEVCYIVVCMKNGAENEFQGRTFTGIGITVHATQSNATD